MKLSELLGAALADLRKQEQAPDSAVDMGDWIGVEDGVCKTCLAGAWLRWSLGQTAHNYYLTGEAFAIDRLRGGYVQAAASFCEIKSTLHNRSVPRYWESQDDWWTAMQELHADLVAAGE